MIKVEKFATSLWEVLNYPFIVFGKSSLTLWIIFFTIFLLFAFVFSLAEAKNWLIRTLSKKPGFNISNWRTAITLCYYALLFFGIIGILQTTGLDLSLFTILTGAIGIGVGFGMQSIFSNFISGIIILLEKPLKLGDRIEIGSVSGNVQNISMRATTLVTNDNISFIVPNSDFISKQVINWSHSGRDVRISIPVSVAYDSNTEMVEKLLLEVADKVEGVLKSPAPVVRLTEFGDSGLKFSLLVWTQDYSDRAGALKSLLNFGVLKLFREKKINMPFPQRDIHVHNAIQPNLGTPAL